MNAEEAYASVAGNTRYPGYATDIPLKESSPFVCPNCGVLSQHLWGIVSLLTVFKSSTDLSQRQYSGEAVTAALCQTCNGEAIFLGGKVLSPSTSLAPQPAHDLPDEVLSDYIEAREILHASPRGAAALLRLVIQKLCPLLGATKTDINGAIGELVASGKISSALQQALDTVRVIGNEAVHPGTLDLKDDRQTACALFGLINFIVEKAITEPKQIGALYQALPAAKLAGIAQRDGRDQ